MKYLFCAAVTLALAAPASAESVKSEVMASNGVAVTVYADEFAARYEYTAPSVKSGPCFALVARVKRGTETGSVNIQGSCIYSGSWRFYSSAIFKGGATAPFASTGRDVGSCRYGCTLTESFRIDLTPAQIKAHTENGIIAIQIRASKTGDTHILEVPASYFAAVSEVSSK
ncbi:MAG TPA: hypothetical protein VFR28_11535 [Allosphingosinicella sp.]|jgi:hypothetical protein|nr:hypothetical protein [Allosphingosinicella sp.]